MTSCCDTNIRFQQLFGGGSNRWYVVCTKCGKIFHSVDATDTAEMYRCRVRYGKI